MARNPNSTRHKGEHNGKGEVKCIKCGCIRIDEPGYHRQYKLNDYNEFHAPKCIKSSEATTKSAVHTHVYYLAGSVEREINDFHYYAYKFKCDECGGVIINSGGLPEPHRDPKQYANTYNQYYKTLKEEKWQKLNYQMKK